MQRMDLIVREHEIEEIGEQRQQASKKGVKMIRDVGVLDVG